MTAKPHARVPLADSLTTFVDENNHTQYRHPYEAEIAQLRFADAVYQKREPILYQPVETTQAVWVDTFEGVEAMLEELRAADEIAVDLEHHDYRTYVGLLSLMQISTRSKDWVIDTLQPWRHKLEILNEVFADPTKLKVFHGASSDIVWLQRDLGLYVVGLFDTYFACDCLEYSKRSLAFLLDRFVHFDADKKYQMADWRIRPLPEEMLYYARSDTHYLLYIYDMVRNELADKSDRGNPEKDLTKYVLQKSKEVSLQRHEALLCDPETGHGARGWLNNLVKTYSMLTGEQFAVYRALFQWRDDLARRLDESPGFLMPIRVLSDIARILPPDRKALWSLLNNTARVTKSSMEELFTLIQDAVTRGATGQTSTEFLRSLENTAAASSSTPGRPSPYQRHITYVAKANASAATQQPLPDVSELRSNFSQLWGQMPINSDSKNSAASGGKNHLNGEDAGGVPIEAPWFVQAAIASATGETPSPASAPAAAQRPLPTEEYIGLQSPVPKPSPPQTPQAAPAPKVAAQAMPAAPAIQLPSDAMEVEQEEDEVFTLKWGKQKSGKQPAAAATASSSGPSAKKDKMSKKERRAAKKEAKQAKRASKELSGTGEDGGSGENNSQTSDSDGGGAPIYAEDEGEGTSEFIPFNYDTAGSVLHADKHSSGAGKKQSMPKGKAFNPHGGKGDDGPKAARRMHYEKMGKSGTFKK